MGSPGVEEDALVHASDPLRPRNPRMAAELSIVPGLGQIYNREPAKAAFFFVASLLPTAGASVLFAIGTERLGPALINGRYAQIFPFIALIASLVFLALFVLGLAFWASAVVDARRTAQAYNEHRPSAHRWWLFRW